MAWQKRGENADGGKFPGGTWHIFPHVIEKTYVDGEIVERVTWRGVVRVKSSDKMYWKASQDKRIIELWMRDKIKECREFKMPTRKDREPKMTPERYMEELRQRRKNNH